MYIELLSNKFMQNIDLTYYNEALPVIEGNTNGYTKLALNFEKRLPIKNRMFGTQLQDSHKN